MDKTATQKLYGEIRNGAHMGIDAIDEMMKKCSDKVFLEKLLQTQQEYKNIAQQAADELIAEGGIPEELSAEARMGLNMTTKMRLAWKNHDERTMARMVLKGMDMAEKEMHRDGEAYRNASEKAHKLADHLLEVQEKHREFYRKYI